MSQEDANRGQSQGAPGEQKEPEIPESKPIGKGGPLGNQKGLKHGAYSSHFTPEEEKERARFERGLRRDLGEVSTAQRSLIRRASFLEIRLRRCERATEEGMEIADEHVLAWINSQRLLLCALGLERKAKAAPDLQRYLRQKEQSAHSPADGSAAEAPSKVH